MAKLYFRYGAMNSGKSTALMQVAHNYEEQGMRVLILKPQVDTKGGGELFNGFQHETERIPAHRLEELHQLGTALLGECPENDCTIYRNVFRMAVDVDGQMGKLTGHARETMQREYDRLLRELNHLYTMNHAVKKYREAQHDRT